jgi:hypothetical protein
MQMPSHDEYRTRLKAIFEHPVWTGATSDLDIPPGWLAIMEQLLKDFDADPRMEGAYLMRVQQKYDSWYIHCNLDYHDIIARASITRAEEASAECCEACSAPGREHRLDFSYWTLCDDHAKPGINDLMSPFREILREERIIHDPRRRKVPGKWGYDDRAERGIEPYDDIEPLTP